jgi:hypothetical protein
VFARSFVFEATHADEVRYQVTSSRRSETPSQR